MQPSGLQAVNITAYSVIVQWVVPYLNYTQEQYIVIYGISREILNLSSLTVASSTDISASNITYNTSMRGLIPNTAYYFQLRSINSFGTTLSEIMIFTTLEAGKLLLFFPSMF